MKNISLNGLIDIPGFILWDNFNTIIGLLDYAPLEHPAFLNYLPKAKYCSYSPEGNYPNNDISNTMNPKLHRSDTIQCTTII